MTGFGSPCGACKFLRRKCVEGCVFAPYFCHEQGAKHFSAIHKVFGASNVSKLLMHLPVQDRLEAAVTISYEAQARLQDPIYGCVSQIFDLQQQVVNLQAQLASLMAHAANTIVNGSRTSCPQENKSCYNKFPSYNQDGNVMLNWDNPGNGQPSTVTEGVQSLMCYTNGNLNPGLIIDCENSTVPGSRMSASGYSCNSIPSFDMHIDAKNWDMSAEMEDLQSVAFGYVHQS